MAAALKLYTVTIAGVEHTLQLTAEDAEQYKGAKPVENKK